jgi:hypothetical protein
MMCRGKWLQEFSVETGEQKWRVLNRFGTTLGPHNMDPVLTNASPLEIAENDDSLGRPETTSSINITCTSG